MCKFHNLKPSFALTYSDTFCRIGSQRHLLEQLFRQDNLIDIREQCENHEATVPPLENERICFNTVVYHHVRIDGEEKPDDESECDSCNAFIEAGNWFGRTWRDILRDDRPDLNELEVANDDNIDTFSNSEDEELDMDVSEMHDVVSFIESLPDDAKSAAHHPYGRPSRKRSRKVSLASTTSAASMQHVAGTADIREARLEKFERPPKRIKAPYLTTKPLASAHERSPSPPTAEEIRSMIPRGGIPVAEFRQRIDHGRGYSTPYLSLIQGVANIDEVEGMLYLKDDPTYPHTHRPAFEGHRSHAPSTTDDAGLYLPELTTADIRSLIPSGGLPRSTFNSRLWTSWGKSSSHMARIREVAVIDYAAGWVHLKDDVAFLEALKPVEVTEEKAGPSHGVSRHQRSRFSVTQTKTGVPTLILRLGQPVRTKTCPETLIVKEEDQTARASYHAASSTPLAGEGDVTGTTSQSGPAAPYGSQFGSTTLNTETSSTVAVLRDEGKGKARASPSNHVLDQDVSAAIRVKREDNPHTEVPTLHDQAAHSSAPHSHPSSTHSRIDVEIQKAQASLSESLNDDLMTTLARSATSITEDPGSDEVINATMDGSFARAVNAANFSFEANSQQSGPDSSSQSSSDARNITTNADSQTSAFSSSTAATSLSSSSTTAPVPAYFATDATTLRLRHTLAAQSDRIAVLLNNNQESLRREHDAVTQLMAEQRTVAELEAECQRFRFKLGEHGLDME